MPNRCPSPYVLAYAVPNTVPMVSAAGALRALVYSRQRDLLRGRNSSRSANTSYRFGSIGVNIVRSCF